MPSSRSFGPAAEQMREALAQYSKDELMDLMTHIVKTYVVEGTLPLKPDMGERAGDEHLARLSFPQLVLHLQMRLDHREWSRFSVSGDDVWVSNGGQRVNITSVRPLPPPSPPQYATPPEPAHPPPRAPGSRAQEASPQPEAPPEAPPDPRDVDPFSEDVEASERFGMLEID